MNPSAFVSVFLGIAGAGALLQATNPVVPNCLVTIVEEAQVPAQESGVLLKLDVKEGAYVKYKDPLAQIDDAPVRLLRKAVKAEENAAREKANSDVDLRFATAQAAAAEAEYEKAKAANAKTSGAISDAEVERLKLTWIKSKLQIEQAQIDRRIQAFAVNQKGAELATADNNIERRKITSPFDGIVVQVNSRAGEWVKPGDPVLRVIRMDRLRVEGFMNSALFNPHEIKNRKVKVVVVLARQEKAEFAGQVDFVSPLDEAGREYRVWAVVENRLGPNRDWLLRPGLNAEMTILLP